jgi:hypothetical protein
LVGGDDPALGVDGEGDPGALLLLRYGVEQFDFEARRDGERGRVRRRVCSRKLLRN